MKKALFAALLLSLSGCMISEFEENAISLGLNSPVYTAVFDDSNTKVYSDTDLKLHWNAGDEISIFSTTGNQRYSFDGQTGDREGTFSVLGDIVGGTALANTVAVFPYAAETSVNSDGIISLNLPSVQSYAENSFGRADNTMVAVADSKDSDKLYFKNLCGYLVVRLYGEGVVKSITLSGNKEEKISGQATVSAAYGDAPQLSMSEAAGTTITLDCGSGVTLDESEENAKDFWFVVPPVQFTHGFTVTVTNANSSTLTKKMGVERIVVRNVKTSLAPVKMSPFAITFDSSDLVVMPVNATRDIHYSIISEYDDITVEAHASGNVEAEVVKTDSRNGAVRVTTGAVIDETCKVVVLVSNGSQAIMRTLIFEEAAIEVEENTTKEVAVEGGVVTLEFFSNVPCFAVIPEDAQSWISVAPETKGMTKQSINLILQPNNGSFRNATVIVKSEDDAIVLPYLIEQKPNHDFQLAIEREALIALYTALDGKNWNNNTNWCSDKPVGEWYGVYCVNGLVDRLELMANNLCGELPSSIADLHYLRVFNVQYNSGLVGNIPESFSSLMHLEVLNISEVGLENVFPTPIKELKKLTHLLFGTNKPVQIPSWINSFVRIKTLSLCNIIGPVPSELYSLRTIESLQLIGCFEGSILPGIGNLTNLTDLSIYGNQSLVETIPHEIGLLQNLTCLELSGCGFRGSIPDEIGNLSKLERATFAQNNLTGVIPSTIGQCLLLKSLYLSDNDLTGAIPSSLAHCSHLELFVATNNHLSGDIPDLTCCKQLRDFTISYNDYYGEFPSWMGIHPTIKDSWGVNCLGNHFSFRDVRIIAPTLSLPDIDGKMLDLKNLYGNNRWTLLYSTSGPPRDELFEKTKKLYENYSEKGLEVVTFYQEGDNASIIDFEREQAIGWRSIIGNCRDYHFYADAANWPYNCYPVQYCPHWTLVDNNGFVISTSICFEDPEIILSQQVERLLEDDLDNYYISTDYSSVGTVTTLQQSATGSGIDLVLMGDAFSDRQIADGTYASVMQNAMKAFFSEEPYRSMKDRFNVYTVNVVSATEGYEHSGQALGTGHGDGANVYGNDSKVIEYAKKAVSEDRMDDALIIVMMNEDAYAGTCYMYNPPSGNYGRGLSIAYFPSSSNADTFNGLVSHEAGGHGFAKLGDEYAYEYMGAISADEISSRKVKEAYGWLKNVDFTSDPAQVKWSPFLYDPRYANEGLGCYEGGLTYWTGVWRPTENSIMRYNTGGFNAPSRYAIWYRIGKLAYGESWEGSYEDFVEYDAVNRTPAAAAARRLAQARSNCVEKPLPPLAPPVVVGHSWREELQKGK